MVSDGLFHAFSFFALVFGLVIMADLLRRSVLSGYLLAAGFFLGMGAFQLYDGTIQHKLMRLHQIRYDVDIIRYDWTWNVVAVLLLIVGIGLLVVGRRRRAVTSKP